MRILYLADIRFPLERANGIQTAETCHALARRGHRVTLLTRPDTRQPPRDPLAFYGLPSLEGLELRQVAGHGSPARARLGYLASAGTTALREAPEIDVVLTRDLGLAALLVRLPRGLRAPLVYESHGVAAIVASELPAMLDGARAPSAAKLRRLWRRERRVWHQAEGYVTITGALARDLTRRLGPRENLAVVPDGARPRRPAPARAARSAPLVAYAGHLYPWKGVEVLIDALARLPNVRGLIVGGHPLEGDLARVRERAERMGVSARVEFAGLVPPDQVADLIAGADVLVVPNARSTPSESYTSPLKLFEYLWAARPIVASDTPALREVLSDGDSALLVPPGDPAALAAAIDRVVSEASLAESLGRRAGELARHYSWDRRAERLEAVLDRARHARAPAA